MLGACVCKSVASGRVAGGGGGGGRGVGVGGGV